MAPPRRGLDVASMWDLEEEVTHGEGAREGRLSAASVLKNFHTYSFTATLQKCVFVGLSASNALLCPCPPWSSSLRIKTSLP